MESTKDNMVLVNSNLNLPNDLTDMDIAGRFMHMVATFNTVRKTYKRDPPPKSNSYYYPPIRKNEDYLITQLKFYLEIKIKGQKLLPCGEYHSFMIGNENDCRITIPAGILTHIDQHYQEQGLWYNQKVQATWIVCYLHEIFPDTTIEGWKKWECSHLCIEQDMDKKLKEYCIDSKCLCWESKSYNQSRGQGFCRRICNHKGCGEIQCVCQQNHDPPCR